MKKAEEDYLKKTEKFWSGEQYLNKFEWLKNQLMQLPNLSNIELSIRYGYSVRLVLEKVIPVFQSFAEFEITNERLKGAWAQHKNRIKKNQSAQKAFTTYLPSETLNKLKQISEIEQKQICCIIEELINGKYAKLKKSGKIKESPSIGFQSEFVQYAIQPIK